MWETTVITCENIHFGKGKEIKLAPDDFSVACMTMVLIGGKKKFPL